MRFNSNDFKKQLEKVVKEGLSKKLTDELPEDLKNRLLSSGAVAKYDGDNITLQGGDPEINAEAMAIWKLKKD